MLQRLQRLHLHIFLKILRFTDNFSMVALLDSLPWIHGNYLLITDFPASEQSRIFHNFHRLKRVPIQDLNSDHSKYPIRLFELHTEGQHVDIPATEAALNGPLFHSLSFVYRVMMTSTGKRPYPEINGPSDPTIWNIHMPLTTKLIILDNVQRTSELVPVLSLLNWQGGPASDLQDTVKWALATIAPKIDGYFDFQSFVVYLMLTGFRHIPQLYMPVLEELQIHCYNFPDNFDKGRRGTMTKFIAPRIKTLKIFFRGFVPDFGNVNVGGEEGGLCVELADIQAVDGNKLESFRCHNSLQEIVNPSMFNFLGNFSLVILRGVHPLIWSRFSWNEVQEVFIDDCARDILGQRFPHRPINAPKLGYLTLLSNVADLNCPQINAPELHTLKIESRAPNCTLGNILEAKSNLRSLIITNNTYHYDSHRFLDRERPCFITHSNTIGSLSNLRSLEIRGYCEYQEILKLQWSESLQNLESLIISTDFVFPPEPNIWMEKTFDVSMFDKLRLLTVDCYKELQHDWMRRKPNDRRTLIVRHDPNSPIVIGVCGPFACVILNDINMESVRDQITWRYNGIQHGRQGYTSSLDVPTHGEFHAAQGCINILRRGHFLVDEVSDEVNVRVDLPNDVEEG